MKITILHVYLFIIMGMLSHLLEVESRILSTSQPNYYITDQTILPKMNKISRNLVSLDYYSAPFLKPDDLDMSDAGSFIFKLSGNLKLQSLYQLNALKDFSYKTLLDPNNCTSLLTADQVDQFIYYIDNGYKAHFYIDDLPIGNKVTHMVPGYDIGTKYYQTNETATYYLNNHLFINIFTYPSSNLPNAIEIVGVSVVSASSNHSSTPPTSHNIDGAQILLPGKAANVTWTYSVTWTNSSTEWSDRWDIYYPYISGFQTSSIAISLFITAFLIAVLVFILLRVFRNEGTIGGFIAMIDSGWKSIYADVFRSPTNFMTLSLIVGAGIHIASAAFIITMFHMAGILSIANDGAFTLTTVIVFAFCSLFGSYASMRIYLTFGGSRKRINAIFTATIIPSILLLLLLIGNFQLWAHKYLNAPSGGLVAIIIVLWIFLSIPLSFLSAYFVNSWPRPEYPCHTNNIPRMIPPKKWYQAPYLISFILGFLPFVVINIQIYIYLEAMILGLHISSTWTSILSFTMLIVNIVIVNILIEFYQLSLEDHKWWWRSVIGPSFTSIFIFIQLLSYGFARSDSTTGFYYFMFALTVSLMSALVFSAVGFLGTLYFTKRIYSTLHFD